MTKNKTEIVMQDGRFIRRSVQEENLGWIEDFLQVYLQNNQPNPMYHVPLKPDVYLGLSSTKVMVQGLIPGFDYTCTFAPVKVEDNEVFFIPRLGSGVKMSMYWQPPRNSYCIAGYIFDRIKLFLDYVFIYLLPKEPPKTNNFASLIHVPSLTNIYPSGEICLGSNREKVKLNEINLCDFQNDFIHRMSVIPWNNDLFPSESQNLVLNRWDAQGQKVDYDIDYCASVSNPCGIAVNGVQAFYESLLKSQEKQEIEV